MRIELSQADAEFLDTLAADAAHFEAEARAASEKRELTLRHRGLYIRALLVKTGAPPDEAFRITALESVEPEGNTR